MIRLELASKTDPDIINYMQNHYSHPNGFVGRQLMYRIWVDNKSVGAIAGGSATMHLPGRDEFFGEEFALQKVINNTFYHLEDNLGDKNLGTKVLKLWRQRIVDDWQYFYKSPVIGFETLIELPRTGALYKADNWTYVGTTKGITCKRVGGLSSSEKFGGVRVWNYEDLRPKLVFCKILAERERKEVKIVQKHLF